MGAPEMRDRLRDILREHFGMLLTRAPRQRPDLVVLVFLLAFLVLAGYVLAWYLGV